MYTITEKHDAKEKTKYKFSMYETVNHYKAIVLVDKCNQYVINLNVENSVINIKFGGYYE